MLSLSPSADCKLPMGLASGIIQDSQISASDHVGRLNFKAVMLKILLFGNPISRSSSTVLCGSNEHPVH